MWGKGKHLTTPRQGIREGSEAQGERRKESHLTAASLYIFVLQKKGMFMENRGADLDYLGD